MDKTRHDDLALAIEDADAIHDGQAMSSGGGAEFLENVAMNEQCAVWRGNAPLRGQDAVDVHDLPEIRPNLGKPRAWKPRERERLRDQHEPGADRSEDGRQRVEILSVFRPRVGAYLRDARRRQLDRNAEMGQPDDIALQQTSDLLVRRQRVWMQRPIGHQMCLEPFLGLVQDTWL